MAVKSNAVRTARDARYQGSRRGAASALPAAESAANLDRLIHERTRLAIVSALAVTPNRSPAACRRRNTGSQPPGAGRSKNIWTTWKL
jgi:hypothetical protein